MAEADIWTVVNSLTENKDDLRLNEEIELKKLYAPWMVNKALSNHADLVFSANEMNINYHLDYDMQYAYYFNTVKRKKRPFQKWFKSGKNKYLEAVKAYYGYSDKKALQACSILTEEQLKIIQHKITPNEAKK